MGGTRSASNDQTLEVWKLESGTCVSTYTADAALRACAVGPDGKTVIAGDIVGSVHFLRIQGQDD
jgi:WD40 repeat protein